MVAEEIVSIVLFIRLENCCAKWRTRSGISPWRSRSGGTWIGKTFSRKNRSERNFCSATIASKSRFGRDRKSTRLNSSHEWISYAVFCLKKKKKKKEQSKNQQKSVNL